MKAKHSILSPIITRSPACAIPSPCARIADLGILHIGNYFGMMRPAIALQDEGEALYFIADYHALTSLRDPLALRENSRSRHFAHRQLLRHDATGDRPSG